MHGFLVVMGVAQFFVWDGDYTLDTFCLSIKVLKTVLEILNI
ncbi:hypothetical protein [Fulvivirga sp. M361]|nr:hypothetical protein [Fulvivirga sp. M361]